MAGQKIRKGDQVVVLSGKDKGKTGEVVRAMPKDGKVIVSGVNVAVRHRKPTQVNPQGGLERREAPLHVSRWRWPIPRPASRPASALKPGTERRSEWPPGPGN